MNEAIFNNTLQKTYDWLDDTMDELNLNDRKKAYTALRATLQALRDRLPQNEAIDLGAQLPMLMRGFYFDGWKPRDTPVKTDSKEAFLMLVEEKLNLRGAEFDLWNSSLAEEFEGEIEGIEVEYMVRGVFNVLSRRISSGEINDIKSNLPKELKEMWPD